MAHPPDITPAELHVLGWCQKLLLVMSAPQVVTWAGFALAAATGWTGNDPDLTGVVPKLSVASGAAGFAAALLATYQVSRPLARLGIPAVVPGVGLAVMLAAAGRVRRLLLDRGVRAGVFGASKADLEALRHQGHEVPPDEGW